MSSLRSARALPNDYWTAETVEDYMRCKVFHFNDYAHVENAVQVLHNDDYDVQVQGENLYGSSHKKYASGFDLIWF